MTKDLQQALIKQSNLGAVVFIVMGLAKNFSVKSGRLRNCKWCIK